MIAGVWWGWRELPPPPPLPPTAAPRCASLTCPLFAAAPSRATAQPHVGSPKSSSVLFRQHLQGGQVPGLEVRDGLPAQLGGWGISVPAYLRRCFFQGRDCFFLRVSENLREGLGGSSRDITPSSISPPAVCGPQVVSQMSEGLQTIWGDKHIHPHMYQKRSKGKRQWEKKAKRR